MKKNQYHCKWCDQIFERNRFNREIDCCFACTREIDILKAQIELDKPTLFGKGIGLLFILTGLLTGSIAGYTWFSFIFDYDVGKLDSRDWAHLLYSTFGTIIVIPFGYFILTHKLEKGLQQQKDKLIDLNLYPQQENNYEN